MRDCKYILWQSLPLILSHGTIVLHEFIDLLLLAQYGTYEVAAVFPAFVIYWNITIFFVAVAGYTRIYIGKSIARREYSHIKEYIFIGNIISLFAFGTILAVSSFSSEIFTFIGHEPAVRVLEVEYFNIIIFASIFQVQKTVYDGYWIAVERTDVVMKISLLALVVNFVFSVTLIFGLFGFPESGIKGAAFGTVAGSLFSVLLHIVYGFSAKSEASLFRMQLPKFDTVKNYFAKSLPGGGSHVCEEFQWTVLILLVGMSGATSLIYSNVAIAILELSYIPIIAIGEVYSVYLARNISSGVGNDNLIVHRSLRRIVVGYILIVLFLLFMLTGPINKYFFHEVGEEVTWIFLYAYYFAVSISFIFGCIYIFLGSILDGYLDTSYPFKISALSFVIVFFVPALLVKEYSVFHFLVIWYLFGLSFFVSCVFYYRRLRKAAVFLP